MSRVKISEFRSKQIIYSAFSEKYRGFPVNLFSESFDKYLKKIDKQGSYVVKVDQGIKKRNKLGLVFVDLDIKEVDKSLNILKKKGFEWALVEPFVKHDKVSEKFVALSRSKNGIIFSYSEKGGVDVEENQKHLKTSTLNHFTFDSKQNKTNLDNKTLQKLYELFISNHMTYLELNPVIIGKGVFMPLDAAVEVDSSANFFINDSWGSSDIRNSGIVSPNEKKILDLNDSSPASFNLKILNKDASVFLLLSGGGASVVVADELANQGLHEEIANYGEYSGNPNEDETYQYSEELIDLLLSSKAKKKVLIIGGGTANFTDVHKTFKGLIRSFENHSKELKKQKVSVYVRRGGPNHTKGLTEMKTTLSKIGLKAEVYGPDFSIAELVKLAVGDIKNV